MKFEVSMIPSIMVEMTWPDIEKHIAKAIAYTEGRDTVGEVYGRLVTQRSQLWVPIRMDGSEDQTTIVGAVVTSVPAYPQKKTLKIEYCGGSYLKGWLQPLLAILERFAREQNAESMEFWGRPGWKRILKDAGFESPVMFYEKPLEYETVQNVA